MFIAAKLKSNMEKHLIKVFYADKCTIKRQVATVDEYGCDSFIMESVYIDIPCHLSNAIHSNTAINITMQDASVDSVYKLHVGPDVVIKLNDTIEVTTKAGKVFTLYAGKPFTYPTFTEVNLSNKERAGDE